MMKTGMNSSIGCQYIDEADAAVTRNGPRQGHGQLLGRPARPLGPKRVHCLRRSFELRPQLTAALCDRRATVRVRQPGAHIGTRISIGTLLELRLRLRRHKSNVVIWRRDVPRFGICNENGWPAQSKCHAVGQLRNTRFRGRHLGGDTNWSWRRGGAGRISLQERKAQLL